MLDTCLNARQLGFESVAMVLDAARAAHIPGVGQFGSGFLSSPAEVLGRLRSNNVATVNTHGLLGRVPSPTPACAVCDASPAASGFPYALGPLGLQPAALEVEILDTASPDGASATYVVSEQGGALLSSRIVGIWDGGRCSPSAPLPAGWPGAPPTAAHVCWAYPVEGIAQLTRESRMAFLDVTTSAELQFAACVAEQPSL